MAEQIIKCIRINWDKVDECSYLREIEAINKLDSLTFNKPVTFFVGENGSGKSTLLEAIAVAYGFNPEGGTRNYNFSTYNSHSELYDALNIVKGRIAEWGYFLRAESFYNVATKEEEYAEFGPTPSEKLHKKSHGESFLAIVQKHFVQNSVYILDEPEAALSPQRQLTLLFEINRYAKLKSQFIIATHSPILLGIPDAQILSFDDGKIHECQYEDTESYKVTEMFINNREQLLAHLLRN